MSPRLCWLQRVKRQPASISLSLSFDKKLEGYQACWSTHLVTYLTNNSNLLIAIRITSVVLGGGLATFKMSKWNFLHYSYASRHMGIVLVGEGNSLSTVLATTCM